MKLTMLGTGTAIIHKERRSPAVLIETNSGESVIVDAGWGVPGALIDLDFPLHTLDHLCITHRHADHIAALPALIQSMHIAGIPHYPGEAHEKPLYLHGYPGFAKDFEQLIGMMTPASLKEPYWKPVFEYPVSSPGTFGSLTISATEVAHVPESFAAVAFTFESEGKSIVISGDLGFDERLIELMKGADIAVIEAGVGPEEFAKDGPRRNHLSAYEAGEMAARAGITHLILTHLHNVDPAAVEADVRKHFHNTLTIPEDLQVFEL